MIRFTQQELNTILADFLGKPWERYADGPDAYDCYGLAKAFLGRVGVEIAEIGKVDPTDSRPVYERQQSDYIRLAVPRPWSLVTFSGRDLNAHIGVVLPTDNLFLHCPGRAAGKVIAEPLSRHPWRESVDGYWWPKGYIETVVLLTPMTTTKRAWQFVKAGRCLGEIIEQDITEGRDVAVQVFLDGELIEKDNWSNVVPTEHQQIVVRPILGDGEQALVMAGMMALAVFAAPAAAAWASGTTASAIAAGTASAGAGFVYSLTAASVMMAGGLALNALVGSRESDREPSQHYSWNPQTTQRVGSLVPLVYGTYGVRGNILCAYATSEHTYETNFFTKAQQIRFATDLYHTKIAYSDGPIEGVIDGTERINDRDPSYYADSANFTVEHFRGTDDQAASSIPDAFEIPVGLDCPTNEPATTTFTAVDCDNASLVLRFPNGFTDYEKDGGHKPTTVTIKAEIRIADGVWHTLMNGNLAGDSRNPMRINLALAGTHTGGTPFTLVTGTRYEAKITRLDSTHSDKGDSFLFDCIQFRYNTAQKLPGIAYTAIGAAASKEISGSIQYYAKIKGKLVQVYRDGAWHIEWSDNPAWIAFDLLTRPVIKGNGTTVAYTVEYYKRLDPSYLILADFAAFAAWCDELVPNSTGGTEKRYVFNGIFDADGSAWDQAIRVCQMACAMPFFRGHKVGVVIDKPGTPCQMFNVSNLRSGFTETWLDNSEAATVYDVEFADELADYASESYPVPLLGADKDIPASLDGFGHTKRSQVWRRASRQLRINQHMRRTVEIPASLDAVWSNIGDLVYVQHPALNRAVGGRIREVYADGVRLDKSVAMGTGTHALLVRTHDGTAERLNLYTVASVGGADSDIVTISGVWEYTPNPNDLFTFGEEAKVIDLYRIKGFERTRDGQVLIQGTQYTTDYYDDDDAAPIIQAQVYSTNRGGKSPTILPTTAEAIRASLPDGNSTIDSLIWEGLAFAGNGTTIVTWACSSAGGAGIKYKGTWVPIVDDAVGTTDTYIYFDPNVGDPRYLQHTNNLADLLGQERYVFCVNKAGVAYFKPGLLVTSDEQKLDGIEEGATNGATWGVNITNQPAGIRQMFYQAAAPSSGMATGDYWQDSDDKKWYRYDGDSWDPVQDADVVAALTAATSAQAIADGKIVTHVGPYPPLVAHWKMNDNAANTVVTDSSGNGHNGTASVNTSALATAGKVGSAFSLVAASSHVVTVPNAADLGLTTGGTICFWVKRPAGSGMIVSKGYGWAVYVANDGEAVSYTNAGSVHYTHGGIVPADTWTHVAYQLSSTSRRVYINGVDTTTTEASLVNPAAVADNVLIGKWGSTYSTSQIDDLRIYCRTLTPGEILRIYNSGNGTENVTVPDTGDLWIDSDDNNKPYRWSGSAYSAVGYDVATWSKIVGDGKPASYADVTADSLVDAFIENFENANGDYITRWTLGSYSSGVSIVSGVGVSGGKVLRVTNRADAAYYRKIPYDPSKMYRIRVRARTTSGTGQLYLGLKSYNATGAAISLSPYTAQWFCVAGTAVPSAWTEYTGYFTGLTGTVQGTVKPSVSSPGALITGTAYFTIFAHINYNTTGVTDIDEIAIDIIPENADQIPESATKKWAGESGADVTGAHISAGITNQGDLATLDQVDTPEVVDNAITEQSYAYTEGYVSVGSPEATLQSVAITTTGAPVFIQFSATVVTPNTLGGGGVRVYRGTTRIYEASGFIIDTGKKFIALNFSEAPSGGTYTYYVKAWCTGDGGTFYNRSLYVHELKK